MQVLNAFALSTVLLFATLGAIAFPFSPLVGVCGLALAAGFGYILVVNRVVERNHESGAWTPQGIVPANRRGPLHATDSTDLPPSADRSALDA